MRSYTEDANAMREFTAAWVRANIKNPDMPSQANHLARIIEDNVLRLLEESLDSKAEEVASRMDLLCRSNLPDYSSEWQNFPTEISASLHDLFQTGTRFNLTTVLQLWSHIALGLKQAAE